MVGTSNKSVAGSWPLTKWPYFFLSSSRLLFVDTLDVLSHLVSTFT